MKKILIFLIYLISFLPFFISAKELELQFQKSWGGSNFDFFNSGIVTTDGNIVVVGGTNSSDADGIVSNGDRDAIIVQYDKNGNLIWQKNWGGNNLDSFGHVIEGTDGFYYVVGYFNSTNIDGVVNNGDSDIIILKYDISGNLIWEKSFGGSREDTSAKILEVNDGLIIIGKYWSTDIDGLTNKGRYDCLLLKIDFDGNLIWKKGWGGNSGEFFNDIKIDKNGNIVIVGKYDSTDIDNHPLVGSYDAIVIKLDSDGEYLWSKSLNSSATEGFNTINISNDNEYIISFESRGGDAGNNFPCGVIKYDENGNILSTKKIDIENLFISSSIKFDNNSVFSIGDLTLLVQTDAGNKVDVEGVILNVTNDGEVILNKLWGGSGSESFKNVFSDSKNNIYIVGYTSSLDIDGLNNYGSGDSFLLKFSYIYDINLNDNVKNGKVSLEQNDGLGFIKTTPDEGYEINTIVIKDIAGNVIEFDKLEDGLYSFDLYDDVSIEVTFKEVLTNPKTGVISSIVFIPAIMFLLMCVYFIKKCEHSYEI